MFSHGNAWSMDGYEPLVDRWAAAGFLVIQPTHIIHDFVMLNTLRSTQAAQGAITLAIQTLRAALHPTLDTATLDTATYDTAV